MEFCKKNFEVEANEEVKYYPFEPLIDRGYLKILRRTKMEFCKTLVFCMPGDAFEPMEALVKYLQKIQCPRASSTIVRDMGILIMLQERI